MTDEEKKKKKEEKKVIVNQPRRPGKNSGYANRMMTSVSKKI